MGALDCLIRFDCDELGAKPSSAFATPASILAPINKANSKVIERHIIGASCDARLTLLNLWRRSREFDP